VSSEKQQWLSMIANKNRYYDRVHRIREEITEKPTLLVGGELKPYQACPWCNALW
jgi:hypothetical protein